MTASRSGRTGQPADPRRVFLGQIARAAAVAPGIVALLDGKAAALPRGEETDMEVLCASIALEHHAISLYDLGLKRSLFPQTLRAYAVEFRGDHLGHRDTQVALAQERGGSAPLALASYDHGPLQAGNS